MYYPATFKAAVLPQGYHQNSLFCLGPEENTRITSKLEEIRLEIFQGIKGRSGNAMDIMIILMINAN